MKIIHSSNYSKGFTIIEVMIVLLLVSIVTLGLVQLVPGFIAGRNVSTFTNNHNAVLDKITSYYASFNYDYSAIDTATVVDGGIVPVEFSSGTGTGATITTNYPTAEADVAVDATNNRMYVLTYEGLPTESCSALVSSVQRRAVKVQVGTPGSLTTIKDLMAATPVNVTPGTLATACAAVTAPTFSLATTQQQ